MKSESAVKQAVDRIEVLRSQESGSASITGVISALRWVLDDSAEGTDLPSATTNTLLESDAETDPMKKTFGIPKH
jgi:hypothetical protein